MNDVGNVSSHYLMMTTALILIIKVEYDLERERLHKSKIKVLTDLLLKSRTIQNSFCLSISCVYIIIFIFVLQDPEEKDSVTEYDSLQQDDISWMQKARPAFSEEEQNMEAIRSTDDKIYFRSTRDITAGEELRFWLGPSLGKECGLCTPKPGQMRKGEFSFSRNS